MDIQHLIYFSALCETMNYTTAAQKCYISRQGLRQAIQSMEAEYGITLIENHRNHLQLTPAGQILYEKSQPVLSSFQSLEHSMQRLLFPEHPMRIAVSRSLIPFYAPELVDRVERFSEKYHGFPFELTILNNDEILSSLRSKIIDGALLIDMSDHVGLSCTRTVLRSDEMTLLMSSSHPLANSENVMLEDLEGQTLILMSEPTDCFSTLYQAAKEKNIHLTYQIIPDYYEVGYRILNTGCIAIDRAESNVPNSSHLESVSSLEHGRFTLCCSLILPDNTEPSWELFRRHMLSSYN